MFSTLKSKNETPQRINNDLDEELKDRSKVFNLGVQLMQQIQSSLIESETCHSCVGLQLLG